MSKKQRLFIIDAMALAYRSFYALGGGRGRGSLATSKGIPTGAIYGSALFLNKLIGEQHPDYLVAVTDTAEPTFRHEIYKEYKATRDNMPDDLSRQIPLVFELFERFHCPLIRLPGTEADDVIGTLAVKFSGPNLDAYIVSGDKDFMQLIGDHIFMYAPKKNEEAQLIDRAAVREKFHCSPEQIIDVLALIGDAVDNVPGVEGIGEKGASQLIETYGSLDGIYKNLDKITAKKQREGLERCRDDAYLSRQLVTLKTDVEIKNQLADFRCDPARAVANPDLLAFYQRYEFKSLAQKTSAAISGLGKVERATKTASGVKVEEATFTEVQTPAAQAALLEAVNAAKSLALVVSNSGADIINDRAQSLTLATDAGQRFVVPLGEEGIYLVRPLLASAKQQKIVHGLKFASQMLHNVGLDINGPVVDLEIEDYLIDPNNYDHSINGIASRFLDENSLSEHPATVASAMLLMQEKLGKEIRGMELTKVLEEVEMPLVPVLAGMERDGFYIDAEFLAAYSDELNKVEVRLEREIYAAAGQEFNINSPKQLQELLFDTLDLQEKAGIKNIKKTKTGFSTDESVLTQLAPHHAVPKLILDYRGVAKLKNTYVDSLPQFINPKTHRVHTCFRQTVAATGRLSSDRPNLQNIPMRSPLGRKIREAFRPQSPDHVLISADYSQVEIRLLAHFAKADDLIEAFIKGLDIHTVTAAKIFNLKESEVDPVSRSRAKAVNFGIIYGMGPQRLAAETGVTMTQAKEFIKRYFEVYPGIKKYTDYLIDEAREKGYCTTIMGRRRPIPLMTDASQTMASRGENIAVNAPIQGSAADLIKLAMTRVAAELHARRAKTRMLLQVHDELVFSGPREEVDEVMPLIQHHMEHALKTRVPLKVDIHAGKNWLETH